MCQRLLEHVEPVVKFPKRAAHDANKVRDECLNANHFLSNAEASSKIERGGLISTHRAGATEPAGVLAEVENRQISKPQISSFDPALLRDQS
jgi:hypothetical protein